MHDKSCAAVHFKTPALDCIAACRLFRYKGDFVMTVGKGKNMAEAETSAYLDPWPHTRVEFGVETTHLFESYQCKHAFLN